MEIKKLSEMENNEIELARSISIDISKIDNITINKLFPNIDLSGLYGIYKEKEGISKYLILYDKVIVNLRPCSSEDKFKEIYGVSIDGFNRLEEIGKIITICCFPYSSFPDFFYKIIKKSPPRSSRTRIYLEYKKNTQKKEIEEIVKKIGSGRDYENYKRNFYREIGISGFYSSYSSDLYDMKLLGLDEIIELIYDVSNKDPIFAHKLSIDYCNFLARPVFDCLGGVCSFSENDTIHAKSIYVPGVSVALGTKRHLSATAAHSIGAFTGVHPSELTEFFPEKINSLSFSSLEDPDTFVKLVEKNRDVSEFRSKLTEITNGKNPQTDLVEISKSIYEKYEKDLRAKKIATESIRFSINIGALLPTWPLIQNSDQLLPLTKLILGVGVPGAINYGGKLIEELSNKIVNSISGSILKKPIMAISSSKAKGK